MRIEKLEKARLFVLISILILSAGLSAGGNTNLEKGDDGVRGDPEDWTKLKLWYKHPAAKWTEALPTGNGRLGAMVFGRTDEERIQFNEETYWSGGPYSQTVEGGSQALPEIQRLIFEGNYIKAHRLFGRHLMGYPVEQQKYQSMGDLILNFSAAGEVLDYRLELDLDTAVVTTSYSQGGIRYLREVFSSPVDQVIVVHLSAERPGSVNFTAELRGCRNQAHSNYATDYFQIDGYGDDGLMVRGKSADYLGVEGKIRYEARLKVVPTGGQMTMDEPYLKITGADAVTLYLAAATNFVNYKDLSSDPKSRVDAVLEGILKKSYGDVKADHIREHRRLFRRAAVRLADGLTSQLPTDERLAAFDGANDPSLAALLFQFGRYLLISSSRPGTQPANLQGIWNEFMNPPWDSKYTTNINIEMNYWPAEVGNLSECTEPLFRMIKELTDQGREVARKHYGTGGWVFHQNTDLLRVAAPMDGPDWGTFTTGGAWLCTHLWEHFLFSGEIEFLREAYPVMKGSVEFFLDFLVEHPKYGWLVTNPSTSPENFPAWPGNDPFYDEVCGWLTPGTTICAGSTIDMQILSDLFGYVAEPAKALENFSYCVHNYTLPNLFSICFGNLQVDGAFGLAAAVAEMLLQSHEGELDFLPALPASWAEGAVEGLCARGGFEVSWRWEKGVAKWAKIKSNLGNTCRIREARQSPQTILAVFPGKCKNRKSESR